MTIRLETEGNELLLYYAPEMGSKGIKDQLKRNGTITIKHTYTVALDRLIREENDIEEALIFKVGIVGVKYTEIDSEVLGTQHRILFSNDIRLKPQFFTAYRNISIMRKIDKVIDRDLYIGGEWDEKGGISVEVFKELLKTFPKTAELNKYADYRIASCISEYFPELDRYEKIYREYINKNDDSIQNYPSKANIEIEIAQFTEAYNELNTMLMGSCSYKEKTWQPKIHSIIQMIYPQYILAVREIIIKGIDKKDKQPDFIMIDTNGYVDILEIKSPDVRILTKQASYRNNYVPVREFSGAVQQIEKYIYCLNTKDNNKANLIEKLSGILPESITPAVLNPKGILLLGRSKDFNNQQRTDFELIKRQYKNIVNIMTYDDLLKRLENILVSLKMRRNNGC